MEKLILETERLVLLLPQPEHAQLVPPFLERNRAHFAPWDPPAPEGIYTADYWAEQIINMHKAFSEGSAVRFWFWAKDNPKRMVGTIGFSQIARGPFCACALGYKIDHEYEGRGFMREALQAAIRYMFDEQKLHRIGANYRPENIRSGRLLAKLGFNIEGFSRNYLFIDGAWRDHILTSITNNAFRTEWLIGPTATINK
jgi:[ribosomal protein S5]-alanine N-acetyltransferase